MENLNTILKDDNKTQELVKRYQKINAEISSNSEAWKELTENVQMRAIEFLNKTFQFDDKIKLVNHSRDGEFSRFEVKLYNEELEKYKEVFGIIFEKDSWRDEDYTEIRLSYYTTSTFDNFEINRLSLIGQVAQALQNEKAEVVVKEYNELINYSKALFKIMQNRMDELFHEQHKIEYTFKDALKINKWKALKSDGYKANPDEYERIELKSNTQVRGFKSIELFDQKNMDTRGSHNVYVTYNDGFQTQINNVRKDRLNQLFMVTFDESKKIKELLNK